MAKRVTSEEKSFVRKNYEALGARAVAERLGRSVNSVHHIADRLDMPAKRRLDAWTSKDDSVIRKYYFHEGTQGVARRLKRTSIAVSHRASRMGLRAGPEVLKQSGLTQRRNARARGLRHKTAWGLAVKERDDFTCRYCGLREPLIVTAHHVVPANQGGSVFDISNGITLCPNCHAFVHAIGDKRISSGNRVDPTTYALIREMLQGGASQSQISAAARLNSKTVERIATH